MHAANDHKLWLSTLMDGHVMPCSELGASAGDPVADAGQNPCLLMAEAAAELSGVSCGVGGIMPTDENGPSGNPACMVGTECLNVVDLGEVGFDRKHRYQLDLVCRFGCAEDSLVNRRPGGWFVDICDGVFPANDACSP